MALVAEDLFLRKQLAMFQERSVRPRRAKPAERLALLALARFFNWREVLVIVKPATLIGWHRTAFRAFWRWKLRRPGRPSLPKNLRELIREMAAANPIWGEERIADELSLKLGILISPRTAGKYLEGLRPRGSRASNLRRSSAGGITNTGWRRRLHSADRVFADDKALGGATRGAVLRHNRR